MPCSLLKQKLQEKLGFASGAVLSNGKISWRKSKDSITTDYKRLSEAHPEWVKQFEITKPGSRRFVVQVGK